MISVHTGGLDERIDSWCVGVCWEPGGGLVVGARRAQQVGGAMPLWIRWILAGGNSRGGGSDALEVLRRPRALGWAVLWSRVVADD
ncbi:hypothetical protein NDU88_003333 [Pleurodeles waltl]|uniref:Uncharacterized protein n=1 Tax=Pleurodeles waltl TaxID=8319 RepID=A0AAV7UYN0_PLEWA|nr:hypothetical protein NDU88_003333 [Pleurodeles waltl]